MACVTMIPSKAHGVGETGSVKIKTSRSWLAGWQKNYIFRPINTASPLAGSVFRPNIDRNSPKPHLDGRVGRSPSPFLMWFPAVLDALHSSVVDKR